LAKAAELTKGITDNTAKLQALYGFVSTQYRYIGIAFGIGRYQPHAADDVLTNSSGDCKDKQTLLASLLQASGFSLYPALINSS
jgi:transglutaminase-like putative cysteine protease